MKITALADTHRGEKEFFIQPCNILIHAGDADMNDEFQSRVFLTWFKEQPADHHILIAGNHDFYPYNYRREFPKLCQEYDVIYLLDSETNIGGLTIYGTPWTKKFGDWAFMKEERDLREVYAKIPNNIDILITHGPAKFILDQNKYGENCGSLELGKAVYKSKPMYHFFGHIHEQGGRRDYTFHSKTLHYNVSVLDEYYNLKTEPTTLEVK